LPINEYRYRHDDRQAGTRMSTSPEACDLLVMWGYLGDRFA
jgi:hypothetical protein